MDALLFAAGLGTRLRPLTNNIPKALVPVAGVPMLERVATRVIAAGADRIVINTHHFADRIEEFVAARNDFGVTVVFSPEPDGPFETGGGLLHAAPLLRADSHCIIHNTDIITDFDLRDMCAVHERTEALATLAVNRRSGSARYVLFDDDGLCGLGNDDTGYVRTAREPRGEPRKFGFCGVQVIAPGFADLISERGKFGIFELYMRLAAEGRRILPYDIGSALWLDIGSAEKLAAAERALAPQ